MPDHLTLLEIPWGSLIAAVAAVGIVLGYLFVAARAIFRADAGRELRDTRLQLRVVGLPIFIGAGLTYAMAGDELSRAWEALTTPCATVWTPEQAGALLGAPPVRVRGDTGYQRCNATWTAGDVALDLDVTGSGSDDAFEDRVRRIRLGNAAYGIPAAVSVTPVDGFDRAVIVDDEGDRSRVVLGAKGGYLEIRLSGAAAERAHAVIEDLGPRRDDVVALVEAL